MRVTKGQAGRACLILALFLLAEFLMAHPAIPYLIGDGVHTTWNASIVLLLHLLR